MTRRTIAGDQRALMLVTFLAVSASRTIARVGSLPTEAPASPRWFTGCGHPKPGGKIVRAVPAAGSSP
jgi:hypothetical protein